MDDDCSTSGWYGYSLKFDYVVNIADMECGLWKEARIYLSPFDTSWMRVNLMSDDGPVRYRVEFDLTHVSLENIHNIIGAYLMFQGGVIVSETGDGLKFRDDDDLEWVKINSEEK